MVVRGISTLALDMDGTLLNSAKQVSGRTQAALRALLGQGIDVVAVTGKAPALTASGVAPLELPMVCLDGAVHVVAGVERWVPGTMVDDALAAELLAAGDGPCYVIADGATFVRGPIEEPQFIDWSDRVAPLTSRRHLRRVTHLVFPHRERTMLAALARRVRAIAGRLGDQQLDLYLTEELFHGSYSLFIRSAACSKLGGMRALLKRLHCSESRRHSRSPGGTRSPGGVRSAAGRSAPATWRAGSARRCSWATG